MALRISGLALAGALVLAPVAAAAQTPADQLAKPPADAAQYGLVFIDGTHGKAAIWTTADGTLMTRESFLLRGQVWEQDEAVRLGKDGMPSSVVIRGVTPQGDAAETFSITGGKASWKSPVDAGSAAYGAPAFYVSESGPFSIGPKLLIEALMAAPGHALKLLPGGEARAERLTETEVGAGAAKKTIVLWNVAGISTSPTPIWTTEDGRFFGTASGVPILPAGFEGELDRLSKLQDSALAARSPALVKTLLKTPAGPVAFTHVRAFLDGSRFAADQTVVVDKGVIVAEGPSASTPAPAGAEVIDGKGETLVPGLWDSHQHFGDDSTGPFLLSLGVTSVRDPGNDNDLTLARAARRASGQLLSPKVYPSMILDGRGPNTAQMATVVTSLDDALADVRKAKAEGFKAIKIYGSYPLDLVAPTAAEAHRLGLHVHGHIPAGLRPAQAIADGYDEVTHIYFVMMQAMPDDVVAHSNGMGRFEGTGRYARNVDLSAEPMKSLIATMAERHITSDPTLVVAESLFVPENGDIQPAYAPYMGTLPPATERGLRTGGFAVPKDLTRADYRKSFAKLSELVEAMHKSGVRIVAGTDGTGMELVRELELYVDAGFTPEEALAAATIEPSRMLGVDTTTGSIAVGKSADLVLVEGDPSKRIGDLRHTRLVMMGGQMMDADALRTAAGFSGRPK